MNILSVIKALLGGKKPIQDQVPATASQTDTNHPFFSGWLIYKTDPSYPGGVNPNYEILP
jgi:hypothetical protein